MKQQQQQHEILLHYIDMHQINSLITVTGCTSMDIHGELVVCCRFLRSD